MRSLRLPAHLGTDRIEIAKMLAKEYLRRHLTPEEQQMFLSYMAQDPINWFERFDRDTGGVLGKMLAGFGYTESLMGMCMLNDLYKQIIEESLAQY